MTSRVHVAQLRPFFFPMNFYRLPSVLFYSFYSSFKKKKKTTNFSLFSHSGSIIFFLFLLREIFRFKLLDDISFALNTFAAGSPFFYCLKISIFGAFFVSV